MSVNPPMRRVSGIVLIVMLASALAACGGGKSNPTPTPAKSGVSAPTANVATVAPLPTSKPATASASPLASPAAGASPVAANAAGASITREQFQKELLAAYPMEPAKSKGGTIVLGEPGDISTLNPILVSDDLTNTILGTIFEPLVGLSPIDGTPVPVLADSWGVSPDGLTYTFHLNKQARWQDGVDFTADDVKFSFDAALDPNTGYVASTTIKNEVASYRVIDPDTFEMVAKDRFVSFIFDGPGGVYIVPQHIWGNVDVSTWSFDGGSTGLDPSRVVGTGPFKFKEWKQGESVTVVRNDAYYDVIPNIDTLTLAVQPDAEAAVTALESGSTDIMQIIPPAQTQSVADTPGLKVDVYNFYSLTLYMMNLDPTKTPLFQSKEVRQALFYGLDRDSITKNIFFGYGEPAVGTQPKLSPAYAPDKMTPAYTYDVQKAKDLLAQAGWTDSNHNGTVDKDGRELKFDLIYSGGDATVEQIIAYMKDAWKQIGVDMNPRSVDASNLEDQLKAHDFDMALLAFNLSPDSDQGLLFSCSAVKNGFNFMGYCNPQWDALEEQEKREFDPAVRTNELIQQSQIIWDEQPVGPIRFGIARTGYNARIHNFYPNGYGYLWSLSYLWVEPSS
jgi:peptide/nickel transport system substrate-binding protein